MGAPSPTTLNGAVYLYQHNGSSWTSAAVLSETIWVGGNEFSSFGSSLALNGPVLAVGGPNASAVWLFFLNGSSWLLDDVIQWGDGSAICGCGFGLSVAVDLPRLTVGAYQEVNPATSAWTGAAHVYRYEGSVEGWNEEDVYRPSDAWPGPVPPVTEDGFGASVALSGPSIWVGAPNNDHEGVYESGAAYVFESAQARLLAPVAEADGFDEFGVSVAAAGDVVVVGARFDESGSVELAGAAYVYRWNGADWGTLTKLEAPAGEAQSGDRFGYSVAAAGDVVVVGADLDESGGVSDAGAAYVYRWNGADWGTPTKLEAPAGDAYREAHFGDSVAAAGDLVVVGATRAPDDAGLSVGAAYVYRCGDSGCGIPKKLEAPAGSSSFGDSVAAVDDLVVVGATYAESGGEFFAGAAYVYRCSNTGCGDTDKARGACR